MNTDRTALPRGNIVTLNSFRQACLGCPDCSRPCWSYMEMATLPPTLLQRKGEAP
jgi:hypothetical protein